MGRSKTILILVLALAFAMPRLPLAAESGPAAPSSAAAPTAAPSAVGSAAAPSAPPSAVGSAAAPSAPPRMDKPLTLKRSGGDLDLGIRLEAELVPGPAAKVRSLRFRALPFFTARGFGLSLAAFDNFLLPLDEDRIRSWYVPGEGLASKARHLLKFIDRIRYGTPKSKLHFHLGPRESLDFAPSSFIATMDGGFDSFLDPGARRLSLCAAYNSDKWDLALFLDDLDQSAGGKLRGGLRIVNTPFGSCRLAIGAGVYGAPVSPQPFPPAIAPFVDLTFPLIDKSGFRLAFSATALCDPFRGRSKSGGPDRFMIEGRFPIEALSGKLRIEIAVAWNKGHRFSSAINDTRALQAGGCFDLSDPAWDGSSVDLVLKVEKKPARGFYFFGYLDFPFKYGPEGSGSDSGSAAGSGSDVAMMKIGWNGPIWSCLLKYSVLGLSSRLGTLLESLGGPPASIQRALGALVGSRGAIAALEGRLRLGLMTAVFDLGFDAAETPRPVAALGLVLDLGREGFERTFKGPKG